MFKKKFAHIINFFHAFANSSENKISIIVSSEINHCEVFHLSKGKKQFIDSEVNELNAFLDKMSKHKRY